MCNNVNVNERILRIFRNYQRLQNDTDIITTETLNNNGFLNFEEYEQVESLYNTINDSLETIMDSDLPDREGRMNRAREQIFSRIAREPERFRLNRNN